MYENFSANFQYFKSYKYNAKGQEIAYDQIGDQIFQ